MTSEKNLTEEFFRVFGIEPKKIPTQPGWCPDVIEVYPEITAERLLGMICIWNYIMPCIDDCIIPIDYLGLKSVVLDKMIRYSEIEYEFDVDTLKHQIQQLFNE